MAQQDEKELDQYLKEGCSRFTARMYSEVVSSATCKSLVLSASSVLVPLAQLSLASVGATHGELLETIGFPDDDLTKAAFARLNNKLQAVSGIELRIASKIYVTQKAELNPKFSATIKEVFNSEVEKVDFSEIIKTVNEINIWVEHQTNHRIKNLVSAHDINASTCSILVNAIYFNGRWDKPFKKENTKREGFYISKDLAIKVLMMHNSAQFNYADSSELNAQLLQLPYKGFEASFIVVLPKEVDGLQTLEEKLEDPAALEKAMWEMRTYDVDLSLPKFKIETTIDLKDVLEEMNVKRIFNPQEAQFSRLLRNEYNLYVSQAIQKAFIEVNEEGSEAAAANEFKFLLGSAGPGGPPKSSFIANRPFYYCLNIGRMTIISGRFVQ